MARTWKVLFEGKEPGPADDFTVTFTDIRDILGGIPVFKMELLTRIAGNIKKYDNYSLIGNVKEVTPPEELEFLPEQYFVLVAEDKKGLKFGFLMILLEDGVAIAGLWPTDFAAVTKEDNRIMDGVLYHVLESPGNWKTVALIGSTKLIPQSE